MTHNELHNQPLNARQGELQASIITLQNAVDDLEAEKLPIVVEKVHTAKSIENTFLSRLDAPNETVQPVKRKPTLREVLTVKKSKKTGFKSPKHKWTPKEVEKLIGYALDGVTNEEFKNNEWGVTLEAIQSKLYKLGFVYRKNRWTEK